MSVIVRKFFVALLLGLLVISSSIAVAEDVDWDSVPHFANKAKLATYIENGRRRGQTKFHFVLTYLKVNNQKELDRLANEFSNNSSTVTLEAKLRTKFGTGQYTFVIKTEYPGTRVANAYLQKDSYDQYWAWNNLDDEEKDLFRIAVGIVDEANKLSSEVEKASYVHKVICDSVKEYKVENERNKKAIGALIDHKAHCQGYSDAFYMLGRMCGLNVYRVSARVNKDNAKHVFNTITFSDGRTYFVDATNDDTNDTNILFCAGRETMQQYFTCDWSVIPNLQWKNLE